LNFFSSKTRENSLRTLQALFSQKYLPDFVSTRYLPFSSSVLQIHLPIHFRIESLTEQLIASLRKGNESESKLAATVTSLFFIQLGQPDDDLFIKFRDAFVPTLRDETKPLSIRKNVGRLHSKIHFIFFFIV
jgi:hypothetical protein